MGQLLQAIENSAIIEIEAGPMLWRIKKICSADLAAVGHAALAMTQAMGDGKEASEQDALTQMLARALSNWKPWPGSKTQ